MSHDNPHDSLFRFTFGRPEQAEAHFRATLPPSVVAAAQWETLTPLSGSFVDPALAHLHTDLLYRVRLANDGELWLYVLFEHQSQPDALMPYRLLRYMVRIWQRWLDEAEEKRPLPFVVPMVLYNGERPWTVPLSFHGLFADTLADELRPFVPDFVYTLQDLARTPDAALQGEALRHMALVWLKHGREATFWDRFPDYVDTLGRILAEPDGLRAIEALLRYLFRVSPRELPADVRALLRDQLTPEAERWWMTWAEQLENRSIERGVVQGREEERTRLLEKLRQQLTLRLQDRFGTLPDEVLRSVAAADEAELDRLTAGLAGPATLETLFR